MRLLLTVVLLLMFTDARSWDQRHEYIRCTHYQAVGFEYTISVGRTIDMVAIIGDACNYLQMDEDIAYALITSEDYFVNQITKSIGTTRLPISRWSFGYTQCTVSTANIVRDIWRTHPNQHKVMARVVRQYDHITGRDLLYDYEMNIWVGLYHLSTLLSARPLDESLMRYNGGALGRNIKLSVLYKNRNFVLMDHSYLWRDGFEHQPVEGEDEQVFSTKYFVERLQLAKRRLNKQ